jgi:shikimate 5-dehydrogenase
VNTLIRQPDGSLAGYNTDWDAAMDAIEAALTADGVLHQPLRM